MLRSESTACLRLRRRSASIFQALMDPDGRTRWPEEQGPEASLQLRWEDGGWSLDFEDHVHPAPDLAWLARDLGQPAVHLEQLERRLQIPDPLLADLQLLVQGGDPLVALLELTGVARAHVVEVPGPPGAETQEASYFARMITVTHGVGHTKMSYQLTLAGIFAM